MREERMLLVGGGLLVWQEGVYEEERPTIF
jgi:hypothetical protein